MKKVIAILLMVILLVILSSCGNRQVGIDTNQTFTKAYIKLGNEWKIVSVKAWRDYEDGDEVQIVTDSGEVYLSHYSNIVLVN